MLKIFFNPGIFIKFTATINKYLLILSLSTLIIGLTIVFFFSPDDYQQGSTVKIMYIHVPAAWIALMTFFIMTIYSILALAFKIPFGFIINKSIAPIGATFTLICLISGSLWGKPMWGTWWVWDARLTSVLLLFFIYIAHISLLNAFDNPKRGERPSAILALVGIINLPIIKWSVDWWNTLHQPASVTRLDTPAIHYEMLIPLLVMSLSFMLYYITIVIIRMHNEIVVRKINSLRIS